MQLFGLFLCTQSALYVSGYICAHHQERFTVSTASDIVHVWPVAKYVDYISSCKYSQVLLMMDVNIARNM